MQAVEHIPSVTVDDYLPGDEHADIRHEYVAGEVFAMAGAGERYSRISLNLAFHFHAAARGGPGGVRCGGVDEVLSRLALFFDEVTRC